MARRTLSNRGRVLAAGLSVSVAGGLAGFMAAGDHTANASSEPTVASDNQSNNNGSSNSSGSSSATPYDPSGRDGSGDAGSSGGTSSDDGSTQFSPQTHTSSGGS